MIRLGGLCSEVCVAQLDPAIFRRWAPRLYLAGLAGLVAVLLVGVGAGVLSAGVTRLPVSSFELMKLVVLMMAAWYLSHYLPPTFSRIVVGLVIVLSPMF